MPPGFKNPQQIHKDRGNTQLSSVTAGNHLNRILEKVPGELSDA